MTSQSQKLKTRTTTRVVLSNLWFDASYALAWPWRTLRQKDTIEALETKSWCYAMSAQKGWVKVGEYAGEIAQLKNEIATLRNETTKNAD